MNERVLDENELPEIKILPEGTMTQTKEIRVEKKSYSENFKEVSLASSDQMTILFNHALRAYEELLTQDDMKLRQSTADRVFEMFGIRSGPGSNAKGAQGSTVNNNLIVEGVKLKKDSPLGGFLNILNERQEEK